MTKVTMSIVNDFIVDCSTTLSQENIINAQDDCSITLTDTDLTNTAYVDKTCLLSASNVSQMSSVASLQMSQMAESITTGWALNPNTAENFLENTFILSQEIVNTYTLDCAESIYQSNSVTCSGSGNIILDGVKLENLTDIESECVLNVLANSEAAAELEIIIDQSAKAEQQSKFGAILPIILGIIALIVIVLIIVKSKNTQSGGSKTPIMIAVGVFLLIVIIVVIIVSKTSKKGKETYPNPKTSADASAGTA